MDIGLVVLPLADADTFRERFDRLAPLEEARVRHAQHLQRYGDRWAALSLDRDAVRRLGEGGLACEDRGEDVAYAVDVPGLVRMALDQVTSPPWRGWLQGLGVAVDRPTVQGRTPDGLPIARFEGVDRVRRIEEAWRSARLWSWAADDDGAGRVRIELEARRPELATVLRDASDAGHDDAGAYPTPTPPAEAAAWLRIRPGDALTAVIEAAWHLGAAFEGDGAAWRRPDMHRDLVGNVLAWLPGAEGAGATLLLAGPLPQDGFDLAAGPWSLGAAVKGEPADGLGMQALGPAAQRALQRYAGHLALPGGEPTALETTEAQGNGRLLATFGASAEAAQALLGEALAPGGLLQALAGGPLEGAIYADGDRLRITVGPAPR